MYEIVNYVLSISGYVLLSILIISEFFRFYEIKYKSRENRKNFSFFYKILLKIAIVLLILNILNNTFNWLEHENRLTEISKNVELKTIYLDCIKNDQHSKAECSYFTLNGSKRYKTELENLEKISETPL